MSLIGLLTATERHVHLGLLHMRPIEWHLKNNWRVPESLEKVKCTSKPAITSPQSCSSNLYRHIKRRVGCSLREHTARGTLSPPESKSIGRSGSICLPTSGHLGQRSWETTGLPVQENHSDCSRVAQHALVLGSSGHVKPDSLVPALSQPFNQTPHRNLSNLDLHVWLLESQLSKSKASLREHELRLLREDQLDQSIRQSGPFLQSGA